MIVCAEKDSPAHKMDVSLHQVAEIIHVVNMLRVLISAKEDSRVRVNVGLKNKMANALMSMNARAVMLVITRATRNVSTDWEVTHVSVWRDINELQLDANLSMNLLQRIVEKHRVEKILNANSQMDRINVNVWLVLERSLPNVKILTSAELLMHAVLTRNQNVSMVLVVTVACVKRALQRTIMDYVPTSMNAKVSTRVNWTRTYDVLTLREVTFASVNQAHYNYLTVRVWR